MNNEESIQYILKIVKELKEENKQLVNKINYLEENNERLSDEITELKEISEDKISKKEMCEYIEEEINRYFPLKDGWEAVYSEENERMGYFNNRRFNEPPEYLYWDRTEHTKKQVICLSDD